MSTQTQTPPASGNKAIGYVGEVRKEMRKVNWPKQNELVSNTTLTLVASFIVALFIFGADQLISRILALVYGA